LIGAIGESVQPNIRSAARNAKTVKDFIINPLYLVEQNFTPQSFSILSVNNTTDMPIC
jgi:hypothetical protein